MILVVDMGNSQIKFGLMDAEETLFSERIETNLSKTATEYAVTLHSILEIAGINAADIEGAILSSVVPPLTSVLKEAIKKVINKPVLNVEPGIKTGIKIKIDDPKTLGADLLVAAVAGVTYYGAPVILVNMGTATTIMAVNEKNEFIGGAVMPGVAISLRALSSEAAKLPQIDLHAPKKVICANTEDCMQSGIVYGQASLLDGMIEKMRRELKQDVKVVATGGLAKLIVPYCETEILLDNDLMLKGLWTIYDRNRK